MSKKQILVVENQFVHYSQLEKGLNSDTQEVIPKDRDDYLDFISAVKVYLNEPGYSNDYKAKCWDVIKSYIVDSKGDVKIELLIMDNVLGGSTICRTGQELAQDIWEKINDRIPILFLSRTDYSDEKRFKLEQNHKKKGYRFEWLMKGFLGYETLEDSFINDTIVKKVDELLTKQWPELPSLYPNQYYIEILEYLKSNSIAAYSDSFDLLIQDLKLPPTLSEDDALAQEIVSLKKSNRFTFDEYLNSLYFKRIERRHATEHSKNS